MTSMTSLQQRLPEQKTFSMKLFVRMKINELQSAPFRSKMRVINGLERPDGIEGGQRIPK